MKAPTSLNQVVARFRRNAPSCAEDAMKDCGVIMQHIGSGSFRDVYRIVGFPLVAKFPRLDLPEDYEGDDPMDHASEEMRMIRMIKKSKTKLKDVRPHIPHVYNYSPRTGVMLMHEYGKVRLYSQVEKLADKVQLIIDDWDSHKENFGKDEEGKIVILDLGYFGSLTHP